MARKLVGGSLSFDPAADVYDATRAVPEAIARRQTDAIQRELRAAGADLLLEVGVGTGRIARPLAERGVRVLGLDIAPRMLAQLRQQLGPQDLPPDLALADATRLPLQPASVPAVLMVHVLHLVSSPDHAVAELRRVLAPGGVFLHDFTRYAGDNPWLVSLRMREEIIAELGVSVRRRPSDGEVHELLRAAGASLRTVVYAEAEERSKPADWLSRTRDRIDSWTWEVPDEAYPEFFTRYERWCREHYGDLEREYAQHVQYELEVWTFDGV